MGGWERVDGGLGRARAAIRRAHRGCREASSPSARRAHAERRSGEQLTRGLAVGRWERGALAGGSDLRQSTITVATICAEAGRAESARSDGRRARAGWARRHAARARTMSQTAAIPAGGAATAAGAEPVVGRLLDSRADFTRALGCRVPSAALCGQARREAPRATAGEGAGAHMTAMRSGRITARVAGRPGGSPLTGSHPTPCPLQGADGPGAGYFRRENADFINEFVSAPSQRHKG